MGSIDIKQTQNSETDLFDLYYLTLTVSILLYYVHSSFQEIDDETIDIYKVKKLSR